MKNLIKKLAAGLMVLGLITAQISLVLPMAQATEGEGETPATKPAPAKSEEPKSKLDPSNLNDLKNLTFPVQDYLKLPKDSAGKDNQGQSYFNTDPANKDQQTKFPVIKFILDVIDTLTKLAGTIAVLLLIITGFVMIFAQGDQNKTEKAKQMFGQEIIGLIVILLSYVLVTIVQGVLTT